jgi:hypothetical protein
MLVVGVDSGAEQPGSAMASIIRSKSANAADILLVHSLNILDRDIEYPFIIWFPVVFARSKRFLRMLAAPAAAPR